MQLELPSILKKKIFGRHPVTKSLHYEIYTEEARVSYQTIIYMLSNAIPSTTHFWSNKLFILDSV